jgi:hypothetical protein
MKRLLAVLAGALVWGSTVVSAQAAPIEPADVASGAKWLVHIDFDAARESKIGEHVLAKARENERVQKGMEKLHDELGMDLQKDLHGATLYGTDFTQHTGVLIVYAVADKEKVVSFLKSRPNFAESKEGDHDLYSWTENMGKGDKHTVWASFPKTGMAVVADSADNVKEALEVVGGKGGLATSSPLLADAPKGTIVRGAVVGLTEAKLPTPMPLAKQIDDVNLSLGESEGELFLHVKVETTGAEAAKQLKSTIDGFLAMGALQTGDKPDLQKMMKALKTDAKDKELTVDWKASSGDLIKLGEKAREKRLESKKTEKSSDQ